MLNTHGMKLPSQTYLNVQFSGVKFSFTMNAN